MPKLTVSHLPSDDCTPNSWNPNQMTEFERAKTRISLLTYGFVDPIKVRSIDDKYEIIDGEHRWREYMDFRYHPESISDREQELLTENTSMQVLIENGEIPAINLGEVEDSVARELTIILNGLSGTPDEVKLGELIADLRRQVGEERVLEVLPYDEGRLNEIINSMGGGSVEEDEPPEVSEEEPVTQTSDLWLLGEHRVLCGDSTKAEDVVRVMDGEKANLVVSSPPYFNQRNYSIWESYEEYLLFADNIVSSIDSVIGVDAVVAWNIGSDETSHRWMPSDWWVRFRDAGWMYQESIAWVKAAAVWSVPRSMHIENSRYFPAQRWEVCLVCKKGNHPTFDPHDRDRVREFQNNVWEIAVVAGQVQTKQGHPAMYPVELSARFITAYTQSGHCVYDLFLGSGTTLIAADQLVRKCYGLEIAPKYCDVIVKRYINHVGTDEDVYVERDGKRLTWQEVQIPEEQTVHVC